MICAILLEFVHHWLHTRRPTDFLGGMPAALLGLIVMVGVLWQPFYSEEDRIGHYRQAVFDGIEHDDLVRAELCHEKLRKLGRDEADLSFRLAVAGEPQHGMSETHAKIARLAPRDSSGHAPAHLWLAKGMVEGRIPDRGATGTDLIESHLLHAIESDPLAMEARTMLGMHYFRRRDWVQAADVLQTVLHAQPEARLVRSIALRRAGRRDESNVEADLVARYYADARSEGRTLEPIHYVRWAAAYQMLADLDEAESILREGLTRTGGAIAVARGLARICLQRAELARERGDIALQLQGLEQALVAYPQDQEALRQLAELCRVERNEAQPAQALLRNQLASGATPWLVHAILGTQAAARGELELARRHLSQATTQHAFGAIALNNLACVDLLGDVPDLDQALLLVDQAIAASPERAEFRETRGQCLLRLNRWEEAISELELALSVLGSSPAIHVGLASAYQAIGDDAMADLHRVQVGP